MRPGVGKIADDSLLECRMLRLIPHDGRSTRVWISTPLRLWWGTQRPETITSVMENAASRGIYIGEYESD